MSSPPARAPALPPPPVPALAAAPSARPPSMRKLLATISKLVRFWPSLSCHSRDWMRPSIKTSEPFFRYCWAISACLAHTTILCHSVRFWRSPLRSLKLSSVASEKLQTAWPAPVYLVSGSLPKRPTRITLLTDILFLHSREEDNTRRSAVQTRQTGRGQLRNSSTRRGEAETNFGPSYFPWYTYLLLSQTYSAISQPGF